MLDKKLKELLFQFKEINSILISDCNFEENEDLKGSIFHIDGTGGSRMNIKNGIFSGKLSNGSHCIDGSLSRKEKQQVFI